MADDCATISESDIFGLKETLHEQQQLLQKLYSELDAEREASATAASETLAVILRLQSEKAAIKMESEQYKRLSEHKICHAEESLAIIEDIIYQKEMEVAALEHQLQSYRCKLLSVGCVDADMRFSESGLQRSEDLGGETSLQSLRRRSASLPLKYSSKAFVEEQIGKEMFDQALDLEKKISNTSSGDIQSYWEQIRKLGDRVKEIAGASCTNSRSETRSLLSVFSQVGAGNSGDSSNFCNLGNRTRSPSPQISFCDMTYSNALATVNETEQPKHCPNSAKNEAAGDYPSSPSIHDVFEVPLIVQSFSSHKSELKCGNNAVGPSIGQDHAAESKPNWLRKKASRPTRHKRKPGKRSRVSFMDSRFASVQPGTSRITESLPGLSRLNMTSEIIEVERPPAEESTNRQEELKLLHEIREQLNSLHDQVQRWEGKKESHTRQEGVSLHSLQEVLSHSKHSIFSSLTCFSTDAFSAIFSDEKLCFSYIGNASFLALIQQ